MVGSVQLAFLLRRYGDRTASACDSDERSDCGRGLNTGDVATVIHVHCGGKALEVEFLTLHGETAAIATIEA